MDSAPPNRCRRSAVEHGDGLRDARLVDESARADVGFDDHGPLDLQHARNVGIPGLHALDGFGQLRHVDVSRRLRADAIFNGDIA